MKDPLPVRIVKHNLLHDGKDSQLHQEPVEGGQLRAAGVPYGGHDVVSHHQHGPRDEKMVEHDRLHGMAKLSWIHLEDEGGVRERPTLERMSKSVQTAFLLARGVEMQS